MCQARFMKIHTSIASASKSFPSRPVDQLGVTLSPGGHLTMPGDVSGGHVGRREGGATGIQGVESRDAAKQPI